MELADITSGLAVALKQARIAKGLQVRQVPKLCGVHSVSRVESGTHNINMGVLLRLADCYGVRASDLVKQAEAHAMSYVMLRTRAW